MMSIWCVALIKCDAPFSYWDPHRIVIDATGIGAGLASFLAKAFPGQFLPFIFTARSKSDLGWSFLSVIETVHFKKYSPSPERHPEQQPPRHSERSAVLSHTQSKSAAISGAD
jgi:hypothetical protein